MSIFIAVYYDNMNLFQTKEVLLAPRNTTQKTELNKELKNNCKKS